MNDCKYREVLMTYSSPNPNHVPYQWDEACCLAYKQAKRKDGLVWAHYPECKPENCPLMHPELLDGATLEMEE